MTKYNPNQNNRQTDLSEFIFGKVTPQAIDIEEAVLGAIMSDKDGFQLVSNILRVDSFYSDSHQKIYSSICSLAKGNKPIDILTVTEELRRFENLESIGGAYRLVEICNRVGSAANIEYHARILVEKEMKRAAILEASNLLRQSYDDSTDIFDLMSSHNKSIAQINAIPERVEEKETLEGIARRVRDEFEARQRGEVIGVSSFSTAINGIINGWQKNKFVVVGARPSMGKTGYCLNEVYEAAKQGFQVNLFSLEMTAEEVFKILASIHCGLFLDKFNGKMQVSPEEIQIWLKAHEYICGLSISIKALSNQTVSTMRSHCRLKMRENGKKQIVFVDYIQLMNNDEKANKGQNREQDVSQLSRGLKLLSGEMECPVFAFAQLNRAVETRGGDKIPQLSDLRESGSLEQDADIIAFLYRPEYYDIKEDENGESTKDILRVIFKKHRGGSLGEAKIKYVRQNQKMSDWESAEDRIIKNGYETTTIYPDSTFNTIPRSAAQNPEDDDFLPF